MRYRRIIALALHLLLWSSPVFAGGYLNPFISASALGMGASAIAKANDLSAVYYNPATLTQLKGTSFLASPVYIGVNSDYTRDPGETTVRSDEGGLSGFAGFGTEMNREDMVFAAGVYVPFGLALGFDWLNWSSHKSLTFDYDNKTPLTTEDTVLPRDWGNSIAVHFGAEYRVRQKYAVRGGYYFDQTPVPDRTLDPLLPQADKNILSIGASYKTDTLSFDFAYAYLKNKDRTVTNSILDFPTDGLYETSANILAFSTGYTF